MITKSDVIRQRAKELGLPIIKLKLSTDPVEPFFLDEVRRIDKKTDKAMKALVRDKLKAIRVSHRKD
jgi:hypothetical protein